MSKMLCKYVTKYSPRACLWHYDSSYSNVTEERCERVSTVVTPLTLADLDDASSDDDNEGCHLSIGENVLHAGAPLYIGRVDECQQA